MTGSKPVLGVTIGDPSGIGSEIAVEAAVERADEADLLLIGDVVPVRNAVEILGLDVDVRAVDSVEAAKFAPGTLNVLSCGVVDAVEYGIIDPAYGRASMAYIERAVQAAVDGEIDGFVSAPVNTEAIERADPTYTSQDEVLTAYTGRETLATMLIVDEFRVSHVSTHVSLLEAINRVTTERVLDTITVTHEGLSRMLPNQPSIAVAGINPHAGDGGKLGTLDDEEIVPAVEAAQAEGIDVVGPEAPDLVYPAAKNGAYDGVVAMYHDQGHIPIKMLAFQDGYVRGVSMTLGIDFPRTGVPHGTAHDIAGTGVASSAAFSYAIKVAAAAASK